MKRERFHEITQPFSKLRLGLVGDFSLDRYLEIDPELKESSIETQLPVHNVIRVRSQPGSAGTILNNLVALEAGEIWPVGFCGEDGEGYELQRALRHQGENVRLDYFLSTDQRRTFTYCKPLLLHRHRPPEELSRLDSKNWTPTPPELSAKLVQSIRKMARHVDALIILDQVDQPETGVVTRPVLDVLREITAEQPTMRVLADSRRGLAAWPALIFKMNATELASLTGEKLPSNLDGIGALAVRWARSNQQPVFVTLAERGILAASAAGEIEHIPAFPLRGPIDIVGAGDAVAANLILSLAAGASLREALEIASTAASIVIHQLGTTGSASVSQMEELIFGSIQLA